MSNVSRPLIALLVATVVMAVVWMVALKPSSSSGGGSTSTGAYQSAIGKAHQAVATSNAANAAHGGAVPTTAATTSVTTATAPSAKPAAQPATTTSPATTQRLDVVDRALQARKMLALLFYNPAATDDRAVKQELALVPTHGAKVVKLSLPLTELARYQVVTTQVPVSGSPTLVLIDRRQRATTIVGFADRFEIAQRVTDALAAK